MFDLTVFKPVRRSDVNHVIEILEYHSPFHYTEKEANKKGTLPATPRKNNKTTIAESFKVDQLKRIS